MSEEETTPSIDVEELQNVMEPQEEVLLESGHVVKVFPVGYKQLKKFSKNFGAALSMLNTLQVPKELLDSENGGAEAMNIYMKSAIPYVINNLLDVVEDTVTIEPLAGSNLPEITLDDVPHWELPPIIHAWILKSFGEKRKISPWTAVVEDLMVRFTNKKMNLQEKLDKMFS